MYKGNTNRTKPIIVLQFGTNKGIRLIRLYCVGRYLIRNNANVPSPTMELRITTMDNKMTDVIELAYKWINTM